MTIQRIHFTPIHGIIVPLLTPLDKFGNPSEGGTRTLTNYLIEQGVHALFPLGTTGEGPLFSENERKQVCEWVVSAAHGRVPVIVHTGAVTTDETIRLTRHAHETGASAAALITPWYYHLSEAELITYFRGICDRVPDFPLYLYNNPAVTGNTITRYVVEEVYRQCPNLVGLKDSGGTLDTLFALRQQFGDQFNTALGPDGLMCAGFALDFDASVSGNANVVPQLVVDLYSAAKQGDLVRARQNQSVLNQVRGILRDGADLSLFKSVITRRGIDVGSVRPPLIQATDAQIDTACAQLDLLGIWSLGANRRKEAL
jgi:4-hydroxy-tetrahydrodipicolinate synthase